MQILIRRNSKNILFWDKIIFIFILLIPNTRNIPIILQEGPSGFIVRSSSILWLEYLKNSFRLEMLSDLLIDFMFINIFAVSVTSSQKYIVPFLTFQFLPATFGYYFSIILSRYWRIRIVHLIFTSSPWREFFSLFFFSKSPINRTLSKLIFTLVCLASIYFFNFIRSSHDVMRR